MAKSPKNYAEMRKLLINLGISTPRGTTPSEKSSITRLYNKFGKIAKSYAKNPKNYKKMHVGEKTLKLLTSDHFDRFTVIGKTARKTTVLVRKPPGEEPHIKHGQLIMHNARLNITRKIIPTRGKNLIGELERAFSSLKAGEYLQIQVGDKTPIAVSFFSMEEFEHYFDYGENYEGAEDDKEFSDDGNNFIAPKKSGWNNQGGRPSDYLSIVKANNPALKTGFGNYDKAASKKKGYKR